MSNGTKVRKRDGSVEPLNLDKLHKVVDEACEGLGSAVSASQVEMNSGIQFYDGITTACLLYTSPSPRDQRGSRMPSSA